MLFCEPTLPGFENPVKSVPDGMEQSGWNIPATINARIMDLSFKTDLTIYIILVAAVNTLLHRYSGSPVIILQSPVYGKQASQDTLNHTVLLCSPVSGSMTFKELLIQTRETVLEAYENQDYPFPRLMKDVGRFQSSFETQSFVQCALTNIHWISCADVPSSLRFRFSNQNGHLSTVVDYNSSLY